MRRRDVLKGVSMAALSAWLLRRVAQAEPTPAAPIPRRKLGRTGEMVSIIGLGGFHVGVQPDEKESLRLIRTALDQGVNFLDNCWDYHGGQSEVRMGKALRDGYRDKAFLMTKIDGRTAKAAAAQIDESLRRLQTDRIDLIQFHEVIRTTDPERIFDDDGALAAVQAAQRAGKVRYIGFTGHKSAEIHLQMLESAERHGLKFDAVQLPLNVMDVHLDGFEKKILPVLVKREIGVLGMKPLGGGRILESRSVSAVDCLHYAMSLPTSVVITGCDSARTLTQALSAARTFKPWTERERAALLAKSAKPAAERRYELYKTTTTFDGTVQHPEWLG